MVAQPEPMVTGDAVVLDVQIAQLPVRALSALIDLTVIFFAYMLGVMLWAFTLGQVDTALSAAVLIIFTILAIVGYPVILEMTTHGRSLGKMALGLRVVADDGGPERFRQALFRALSGFVEIWMFTGGPAVICSMLSAKGKRIGDVFAGTMVISERAPRMAPPPLMPPSMAWWASSLQLSGLRPEQAERARQFLSRATQLNPVLRDRMAHQICSEIAAQVSPPPPPGAPPQVILAAVLAERHRRALERMQPAVAPPSPPQTYAPPPTATHQRPMPPAAPSPTPTPPQQGGFAPPD
jgi:uncharacterized RDD family membrane protein YckC